MPPAPLKAAHQEHSQVGIRACHILHSGLPHRPTEFS